MSRRPLDREAILRILPHRDPFVFLDGVSHLEPGVKAEGHVTVPPDHPYALGQASVPAGLVIEAMAQIGCVAAAASDAAPMRGLFRAIQDFAMDGAVPFGSRIELRAEVTKQRGRLVEAQTRAAVAGREIASATLSFAKI